MRNPTQEGRPALEVLVCFDGAVLAAHQLLAGEQLRVGEGSEHPIPGVSLSVAGLDDLGAWIQFHSDAAGDVTIDGEQRQLSDLVARGLATEVEPGLRRYPLPTGARALVAVGPLNVLVQPTRTEPRLPAPVRFDIREWKWVGAVAVGCFLFLALCFSMPPDPALASGDLMRLDQRTIRTRFFAEQPELEAKKLLGNGAKGPQAGATPAPGVKGRAGDKNVRTHGRMQIAANSKGFRPGGKPVDPKMLASQTGIVGILKNLKKGDVGGVFDQDQTALGDAAETFNGNLDGKTAGPGWGQEGQALVGDGKGGGCIGPHCATDTISVGDRICTSGNCGGDPNGKYAVRLPSTRLRKHNVEDVTLIPSEVKIAGPVDKDTIRRVIRTHLNQVRFCYERELVGSPDLEGKVVVSFLIQKDGKVVSSSPRAGDTTLRSPAVGRCVADTIGRLNFPMPENASQMTQVSYPFVFHKAGRAGE